MLKQLSIKNFQSHKDSLFTFGEGVNAITGTSRHGKSASLRAINWVLTNRPSGEGHISFWAWDKKGKQIAPTVVKITTDEHVIERVRSATVNGYTIDGKLLEAIGTDVPKEVTDALNFADMNMQAQMDRPFLLADSAGEVGRFFNKIVKLDAIDTFQSAIDSKKRKNKADLDANKGNLERVEKELKDFAWVDDARVIVDKLKEMEFEGWELGKFQDTINVSLTDYQKYQRILEFLEIIPKAVKLSEKIDILITKHADLDKKADGLSDSVDSYNEHKDSLTKSACIEKAELNCIMIADTIQKNVTMERLRQNLTPSIAERIKYQRILDQTSEIEYAEKLVGKITKILKEVSAMRLSGQQLINDVDWFLVNKREIDEFDGLYTEYRNSLPSVCPTCQRPL